MTEFLYRYLDPTYDGDRPELQSYPIFKETPKGYWIYKSFNNPKWVSKDGKRRFAHTSREQALYSYFRRKREQYRILKSQLDKLEGTLGYLVFTRYNRINDPYVNDARNELNKALKRRYGLERLPIEPYEVRYRNRGFLTSSDVEL